MKERAYIPGVSHYCDRWCERCGLSARCEAYAEESRDSGGEVQEWNDLRNRVFWDRLEQEVKLAEEAHWLSDVATGSASQADLVAAARAYFDRVDDWFEDSVQMLGDKKSALMEGASMGLEGVLEEVTRLTNLVEVIRWYQTFIPAQMGLVTRSVGTELNLGLPQPADGWAKVALIAMDRSIQAWLGMRQYFPDAEDPILVLLLGLSRLRRELESACPGAREFRRPGFDDLLPLEA